MKVIRSSMTLFVMAFAKFAIAFKTYQKATLYSSEEPNNVASTLVDIYSFMGANVEGYKIAANMTAYLNDNAEEVVDAVCAKAPEDTNCLQRVNEYVKRCEKNNCFELDTEKYPKDKEYQPLTVPDPYQLEAAFYIFANSDSNPAKNPIEAFWMKFRYGNGNNDYRNFFTNLIYSHLLQRMDDMDLEAFVSKYIYMATMYYKVYTTMDGVNAKIMNKIKLAHHLFGRQIKNALKKIIRIEMPEDIGKYNVDRLRHIASSYEDYMMTQIPVLPNFTKRYAKMVVKNLISTIGAYHKQSWFKKIGNKITNYFKYKIDNPTKEFYMKNIHKPTKKFYMNVIHNPAKNFIDNQVKTLGKEFYDNKIEKPINELYKNKIEKPAVDMFTNKIPSAMKKLSDGIKGHLRKYKLTEGGNESNEEMQDEADVQDGIEIMESPEEQSS